MLGYGGGNDTRPQVLNLKDYIHANFGPTFWICLIFLKFSSTF